MLCFYYSFCGEFRIRLIVIGMQKYKKLTKGKFIKDNFLK